MLWFVLAACSGGAIGVDDTGPDDEIDADFEIDTSDCEWEETWEFGYEYCIREIGDIEVKIIAPDTLEPGAPMAVYLHGDTANGYYEDWGFEWLVEYTRAEGMLFVAALAPNGCSWWRSPDECAWEIEDEDGYNSDALAAAFDEIGEDWGVATQGVRYVGYSGGSTFLTGHFVPLYGDQYPGIVVANCGGEGPIYDFAWDSDSAVAEAIPLEFTWGEDDFMGGAGGSPDWIQDAVDSYEDLDWPHIGVEEVANLGHCGAAYDWDARTIELWEGYEP